MQQKVHRGRKPKRILRETKEAKRKQSYEVHESRKLRTKGGISEVKPKGINSMMQRLGVTIELLDSLLAIYRLTSTCEVGLLSALEVGKRETGNWGE